MFRKIALISALILWNSVANAQMPYLDEMKALGTVAGQGLVCGSSKYDHFEMLARAIMLSKAPSQKMLQKGIYAYTETKANTYRSKQMDAGYLCGEIVARFDEQEIFQTTLYEDGTLKMPDGSIITPKMPYDATQIYKKDDKLKTNLKAIYDGGNAKARAVALSQGIPVAAPQAQPQAPNGAVAVNIQPAPNSRTINKSTPPNTYEETTIGHISRRGAR